MSTVSSGDAAWDAAVDALRLFESQYEDIEVGPVLLNQDYDAAGNLNEVVDVTFSIYGRPGQYQVHPVFVGDWTAVAISQIGLKRTIVNGIYDGAASLADLELPEPPASGLPPGHTAGG